MGWATPLSFSESCLEADAVPKMVTFSTVLHSWMAAVPTPPENQQREKLRSRHGRKALPGREEGLWCVLVRIDPGYWEMGLQVMLCWSSTALCSFTKPLRRSHTLMPGASAWAGEDN